MFGLTFREATIIIASLVVVLGCWAFFELADKVTEGDILSFDNQVLTALRNPDDLSDPIGPKWLETAMRDFSSLGSTAVLVVLILSVVGFLILNKRHRQALLIALTSVAGVLLVVGLKYLFIRERPDSVPHLTEVASGSYPSGHAMMSAVVYR